jgi:NAD(P)-dependent dehydrogenase (short-subunit alcohol dehydrogenase family)
MSEHRLDGRRAIVTGASRGIGAGVAERFAAVGAALALVARTLESHDHLSGSLKETQVRCESYGAQVQPIVADLSDEESRARIVAEAAEALGGPIDVIVNNAAAAIYHPMADFSLKRRRLTFEVNVHAPFDLLQAALPGMNALGAGWVVNVSSATAHFAPGTAIEAPQPGRQNSTMGVYGASKAGLDRLSFAFAQELWGTGIRVNVVAPKSAVLTEGAAALMGDTLDSSTIEPVEAMAEAVLLLAAGPEELTGGIHRSLDLLAARGVPVMGLDGTRPYQSKRT